MSRGLDIAILYLSDRRVAYSSLAFHMLKGYLSELGARTAVYFKEDGIIAEREAPHPSKSKIILTSLPYELMYIDLVDMLDSLSIPVWRRDRREGPIILAGGPAITANPTPLLDILDVVLVGEAEPVLEQIVDAVEHESRERILQELSGIEGLLVPGYNERVKRVYVRNLDDAWYPIDQRIPKDIEPVWGRSFMLETTRGCARGCRFCMEGMIFRPKRDRSFQKLRSILDEGIAANRVGKVSFYSLAFFDSPHAQKILEYAVSQGLEVSVPSIRAETLTRERAELISLGGQRTITIAPETGSCRIGEAINKCIGYEGTMTAIDNALEGGLRNVKLYIMIGFPGETDEDFEETVKLVEDAAYKVGSSGGTLKVAVNPFMPKPVTPMQWSRVPDPKMIAEKMRVLRKRASMKGAKVSFYDPKWAIVQTVLARGDRRVGELVVEWARRGGRLGAFKSVARRLGINLAEYLEEKHVEWTPPWHEIVEHPYAGLRMLRFEYESLLRSIS
ncbi:MAG: radical SAM protein [Desulfurococcales archaeon]|nr:radical SAM protein [Desulfurococcales archaeon]